MSDILWEAAEDEAASKVIKKERSWGRRKEQICQETSIQISFIPVQKQLRYVLAKFGAAGSALAGCWLQGPVRPAIPVSGATFSTVAPTFETWQISSNQYESTPTPLTLYPFAT